MNFAPIMLLAATGGVDPVHPGITFNKDIAPIIHAQCAGCHHQGGAAPFPLMTFEQVQKKARMIAKVTADRYMPPWLPEKTSHELAGERRLSGEQIQLIQKWVSDGAPQGDHADAPTPPQFDDQQWTLGKPDLTLTMDEAFEAPPSGVDVLRTFVFPYHLFDDQRLRAIEFHPENPRVIHHASFLIDTTGTAIMLDNAQPGPGYDGMGDIGFNHAGTLGGWSPGSGSFEFPKGISVQIPRHGDFLVEAHINPTGKAESVRGMVGLYFDTNADSRVATAITLGSQRIDIPPGDKEYRVVDEFTLPVGVEVLGLMPHAHFVCQKIRVEAIPPDGTSDTLLRIDDWDFNFLQPLQFTTPVCLPAGTKLRAEFVFDNSTENPQNPHNPPRRVRLGERARDEMALMFLYVAPSLAEELAPLEQAHRAAQLKRMEDGKTFRAQQAATQPASTK